MKIAIIGAGVAGLSCAFELEKNGISPVIFEKKKMIGLEPGFATILMTIFVRHTEDPLKFILNQYGLKLEPISMLKQTVAISENKTVNAKGNLGYIFKRGLEKYSLENQIASYLKTPITFNTEIDINQIRNDYDHIVVASGNSYISKKLNVWTDTFVARSRVATVLGDFDISKAKIWFNTNYCEQGFGFLIPHSPKEATLALVVNDFTNTTLDFFWEKFIKIENIQYCIIQRSDIDSSCGFVSSFKNNNIYLVGTAAGFVDDVIGVGSFNAIESGIFAAQSIINGYDYNQMVRPMEDDMIKLHEIRKAINKFGNGDFDNFLSLIGIPGINQLIYNVPFVKASQGSILAKLYNKINTI